MPNVPNVPGVPALSSYSDDNITLLVGDAIDAIAGFFAGSQWGIYQDGAPVLSYDNQLSFGYKQDWPISTYTVEEGAFQSYDKVQLPGEIRVRISAGASITNRSAMLDSIDAVMSTTDTYDVVTPEQVYLNFNFTHRDLDRNAENVGLIAVDLYLTEIMETATAQFQNTSTPVVAGQVSTGNVSTSAPSPAIQDNVSSNFV